MVRQGRRQQRRKQLRRRGMVVALTAVLIMVLSIGSISKSVQNRKLKKQVQDLANKIEEIETENLRLENELINTQKTLETFRHEQKENESMQQAEPQSGKCAYLTFDDGPHANTHEILDILNAYGVKATFFVNGRESDADIAIYKRIADEGHTLANHTYSHDYEAIYESSEAFMADIHRLEEMLLERAGIELSKIVRLPGGSSNSIVEPQVLDGIKEKLTAQGYRYFDWNVSGEDAVREGVPASDIYNQVVSSNRDREEPVILLHCAGNAEGTIGALASILEFYIEEGYAFDTLDKEYAPDVVMLIS